MAENDHISVEDQSLSFRQIIDSAPALLHTAQPNGYLDFFNQTWVDFAGEPLEKLLGWGWIACIHPEDVEAFVEKMRESFANGRKPFQETSRIRRADGVCRWMLHHKEGSLLRTDEKFVPVRASTPTSPFHHPFSSSLLLRCSQRWTPAQDRPAVRPRLLARVECGLWLTSRQSTL